MRAFVVVVVVAFCGCAEDPLIATFTSRVVQLETCKSTGDGAEGCTREELVAELRNDVVEADDDTFWLYGLPRGGVADRAVLGTRDTLGGFLFVDATTQTDRSSGCVLSTRLELSLSIPVDRIDDVGADDCISLVGRQLETTSTTAECDQTSVPPQPISRTVRRRWEPLAPTTTCGAE
ncbi:MAG: hypothetical protein Q8O67_06955 [Deltaproteobacteria bacterium]|nr:hypothetical protein [Deltaproteobacteria bacterium]